MTKWTIKDITEQTGKTAIITGANSGLGFEATKALAGKNALVIMACRNMEKAKHAKQRILEHHPNANLEIIQLDLANLESIKRFADTFKAKYDHLDYLFNNAGVMFLPFTKTKDGFELTFGVNHLGHFALTAHLLPVLLQTPNSRIITQSSLYAKRGKIEFDNLNAEKKYNKSKAYAQSKLANLLFAFELQRRLEQANASTISVASHPGYSNTNLQFAGPEMEKSKTRKTIMKIANTLFAQSAAKGALPMLYAATAPDVKGGEYFGPRGLFQVWGHPKKIKPPKKALDTETARRLWEVSEQLTKTKYPI